MFRPIFQQRQKAEVSRVPPANRGRQKECPAVLAASRVLGIGSPAPVLGEGWLRLHGITDVLVRRDAIEPGIAYRMRGALPRQWVRSRRCLRPRLAQARLSKDRRERTVGDGARLTGFRDGSRNNASFVRSPLPNDPRRGAGGESGHFCSSDFTTRASRRSDVNFLASVQLPRSDFHL